MTGEYVDVRVIDGVAVLPDGRRVESSAEWVRVPLDADWWDAGLVAEIALVPGDFAAELIRLIDAPPPFGHSIRRGPARPLTRRERFRRRLDRARWWLHDRLFADCEGGW